MRRQEKLINEVSEINAVMDKGEVIHIAMIDNGEPYLVPMSYGFKDGAVYVHCAKEGRKISALKSNPNVCFEVTSEAKLVKKVEACGWTYHFHSVIGRGQVAFVDDKAEKLEGLNLIMEHYGSVENSFPDKAVDATEVLRIDISEITGKRSPA